MTPLAYIALIAALSVTVSVYLHSRTVRTARAAADDRWADETIAYLRSMRFRLESRTQQPEETPCR